MSRILIATGARSMRPLIFDANAERRRNEREMRDEHYRQLDLLRASVILADLSRPIGERVS